MAHVRFDLAATLPNTLSYFIIMAKNNIYTLGLLIVLTALTAIFSNSQLNTAYVTSIVIILSAIKFLLVAFNFMELGKAHTFWKATLLLFLIIYVGLIIISQAG